MVRQSQFVNFFPVLFSLVGFFHLAAANAAALPEPEIAQVKLINRAIEQQWKEYSLNPSPVEDDSKWCRRVFLDLIGRIPTYDELIDFLRDKADDKREKLVSRNSLLNDDKYTEEYAATGRRSGRISSSVVAAVTEENTFTSREGMQKYLRDSFARNKPYDTMVTELVTATGMRRNLVPKGSTARSTF